MQRGISKIRIKNIKGYEDHTFDFEIIPNKPHIFVAPNGFGKSSLAIAFKSLNKNRIDLPGKCFHKCDLSNKPEIEIQYISNGSTTNLKATDHSNDISDIFDVFVINSQLEAKATKQNHGGYTTAIASMEIRPIVLIKTIPPRNNFTYQISQTRARFGANGRTFLQNIQPCLNDKQMMIAINNQIDWHEISLKRTEKIIKDICAVANSTGCTVSQIETEIANKIQADSFLDSLLRFIMDQTRDTARSNAFFTLWQFIDLKNHDNKYDTVIKWYEYSIQKESFTETIRDFNSSWNNIVPKQDRGSLIVEFPEADYLSNGQRDFLTFVLLLKNAELHFKKQKNILIIDEIFDYLDDANLVAFQYYISRMITKFKEKGNELYVILMTHLDPQLFSHFRLNDLKVHYLDEHNFSDNLHIKKLIQERSNSNIKDFVDHYLFHYTSENQEREDAFTTLGIRKVFGNTQTFHPLVLEEAKKYIRRQEANPFAVCIAVRVRVEKLIYDKLATQALKDHFIETHETEKKLIFAKDNGVEIPETYYLLGIIYNQALHTTTDNEDIIARRLLRNLTNITIKKMIASLFPEFS